MSCAARFVVRAADKTGRWRISWTWKRKDVLLVASPSLTLRVMAALPKRLLSGVSYTVRLAPDPPKTKFAFGTRLVSEEVPLRRSEPAGVSRSLIVKATVRVAPSLVV